MAGSTAVLLALAACSDSPTDEPPPVLNSVAITPANAELRAVGDSVRLAATAVDQNGDPMAGHTFQWTSSDTTLATVDATGMVRARIAGTVTVTAETGGKSATASITLALQQTATVPASGGTLEVGGAGRVVVPSGAFAAPQAVNMEVTHAPETETDYTVTGETYHAGPRVRNEVRVRTGSTLPLADLNVEMVVPTAFAATLPSTHRPQLFIEFLQSEGEEILDDFVPVPSTYDAASGILRAALPPAAFTHWRRTDQTYEAIVVVGSVPVAQSQLAVQPRALRLPPSQAETSTCTRDALGRPLDQLQVTSAYTGTGHKGVDLRADTGTAVYASREGTVEKIGFDERPLPKPDPRSGKMVKGWGRYVRIRHADGSSTLYAHLTENSTAHLQAGAAIAAGAQVARSGNTGGSSGPHLHLEYVRPDGAQFNPTPCIAARIDITPASSLIGMGQTVTLQARVTALDGSDLTGKSTPAWSSSDANLATVSASGLVRANSAGRTGTAQVEAALGRLEGSASVTVSGLAGSWSGTWTNTEAGNSGGMWLTVQLNGTTATGEVVYSNGGGIYFQNSYQGTATATTLRIVLTQSNLTEEIDLALSGNGLTGTIVDHYSGDTVRFTASLTRDTGGGTSQSTTATASGSGPSPGGGRPR
jgi:murein DD-endopeptidase MepM/ murein hydrolase activator NlpD